MESNGKVVPNVLPTLRGKKEVEGKQAVPNWMLAKDVDAKDQSVAGYIQRTKNALFGGLQQDIFAVRHRGAATAYVHVAVTSYVTCHVQHMCYAVPLWIACHHSITVIKSH
jgi:hypothetical protein